MKLNTGGIANTAMGEGSLQSNTTGVFNTATGYRSLQSNTFGNFNTANGYLALQSNTTGESNTAIGNQAMRLNTTGTYNTAIGDNALRRNTTGFYNTATGQQALNFNTSGGSNTADGTAALFANTTGNYNTATGQQAMRFNTTGEGNTAIGFDALFNNNTGFYNTAVGYFADVSTDNLTNATAIGNGAIVDASNKIRLGNDLVTVLEAQVGLTVTSDRNKKENFRAVNAEEVLKKVGSLDVTSWNYIGHDAKQFRHYGPMAQDFYAAFGNDGLGIIGTPTTIMSSDIDGIMMLALKAVEKRTADLQRENELLRAAADKTGKGTAVLDANGEAWVTIPLAFDAVPGDFQYQLTAIGAPGASLYIAEEVQDGRFKIAGGRPGAKVSWQVSVAELEAASLAQ